MNNKTLHFYWLDLLRFLAAFAVVMCHFRGAFFVDYSSLPSEQQTPVCFIFYVLTRLGHEAVLIFFVLSGFLVGGRSIEKMRQGVFDGRNYVIDRFVRIMLPLSSALLLYIPVMLYTGAGIKWRSWLGCWVSLQGILTGPCIEPLWSLSYEVWFYILILGAYLAICSKRMGGGRVSCVDTQLSRFYKSTPALLVNMVIRRNYLHCKA